MFDPTAFPYVRAQTYVDGSVPAVSSGDFYNPIQDSLARLYGGLAGYSTTLRYEEFDYPVAVNTPAPRDPFGVSMTVTRNTSSGTQFASFTPDGPNQHGVYRISGVANGNRGGTPGFQVEDIVCFLGTARWIFRARIRCSRHSVLTGGATPGLVAGLNDFTFGSIVWYSDGTGFWRYQWDAGRAASAIPTVDGQWVTLWITLRDADGLVRWYLKRDFDPVPVLVDTQALAAPNITVLGSRFLSYSVTAGAAAADSLDVDTMSLQIEA